MVCGVGVIGAGTVGLGVIQTLMNQSEFIKDKTGVELVLRHVADKNLSALEGVALDDVTVSDDANALIDDDNVHIVCELIGGLEPARSFIIKAMEAGKHVITANKMLLAMEGPRLTEVALRNKVALRYEASVAGGIPIIKSLREGLACNHIEAIYGILNGTCNYILTRMTEDGLGFNSALVIAQELGFAETPPDLDIGGHDTAHKCQILASLAYCTVVNLDDIHVEGITKVTAQDVQYAKEAGYIIKLLAVIKKIDNEIEARVQPMLVPNTMLLAQVSHELNAVFVQGDVVGPTLFYGRGAGRWATASAVVSDIVDVAGRLDGPKLPPFHYSHDIAIRDIGLSQGRFYLRMTTQDHPGVLGKIFTMLGNHGVSVASCFQHDEEESSPAHIVLMTHTCLESSVMTAVEEIDALDFIWEATHVLRIL